MVPGASYKAENNHALHLLEEIGTVTRSHARVENAEFSRDFVDLVAGATSQIEIAPISEGNPGMIPVALNVYARARVGRSP